MPRVLPRAFFWIDQALIRQGIWSNLSPGARLLYVALSATVDREGICIWKKGKLMPLAGIQKVSLFESALSELELNRLIERQDNHLPPAIRLCSLGQDPHSPPSTQSSLEKAYSNSTKQSSADFIIHTTVQIGGNKHALS